MRNRANVLCAILWTFNAGLGLGRQPALLTALQFTLAVFYSISVFGIASRFDRVEKEVIEEIKNKESGNGSSN